MRTYKYINHENNILNIDAIYIITIEDSPRINNVYKQIKNYNLSKNNYIQINKKYTDHDYKICKNKSYFHLIDNYVDICKHSIIKNYNNILIFEDDFILDPKILNINILKNINKFINTVDFNLYYLGCLPIFIRPFDKYNYKTYLSLASHSIIYSKQARLKIINKYQENKCLNTYLKHYDYWISTFLDKKYMYHKPLCYQKLNNTENRKEWDNIITNIIITYYELDHVPEKGFNDIYKVIKYIHLSLLIILLNIILYIIYI